MSYLKWKEEKIKDNDQKNISKMYSDGFVFTRIEKNLMQQTRSIRIDLSKFELSSENKRILKKIEGIELKASEIPYEKYSWKIGKIGKDFYESRKADFSANKIKELSTTSESNFNLLLNFSDIGFAICYINEDIMHYSYPFYDINKTVRDMGLGMMIKSIILAKEKNLKYIYLGSLQRVTDTYKLQFSGIEWFDGKKWNNDIEEVKKILNTK
jgi:arginyl-tRNA--protein-N-Asp/Glu arginylyltransferase